MFHGNWWNWCCSNNATPNKWTFAQEQLHIHTNKIKLWRVTKPLITTGIHFVSSHGNNKTEFPKFRRTAIEAPQLCTPIILPCFYRQHMTGKQLPCKNPAYFFCKSKSHSVEVLEEPVSNLSFRNVTIGSLNASADFVAGKVKQCKWDSCFYDLCWTFQTQISGYRLKWTVR